MSRKTETIILLSVVACCWTSTVLAQANYGTGSGAIGAGAAPGGSIGGSGSAGGSAGFSSDDGQFDISHTRSGSGATSKISAAVHTKHTFETKTVEVPFEGDVEPQIIEIEGGNLPLELHFKSASGRIKVRQSHELAGSGHVEHSEAEEEPMRLIHSVRKPIIQEVREIITPFRKVVQEIQPVQEEIHTIVAKGEQRRRGSSGPNKGGSASLAGAQGSIGAGVAQGGAFIGGGNAGISSGGAFIGGGNSGGSTGSAFIGGVNAGGGTGGASGGFGGFINAGHAGGSAGGSSGFGGFGGGFGGNFGGDHGYGNVGGSTTKNRY